MRAPSARRIRYYGRGLTLARGGLSENERKVDYGRGTGYERTPMISQGVASTFSVVVSVVLSMLFLPLSVSYILGNMVVIPPIPANSSARFINLRKNFDSRKKEKPRD